MDIAKILRLDLESIPQAELVSLLRCEDEIEDPVEVQVYDTLVGNLIPECCLEWVENICVPGQPCYEEYRKMLEAYERLCQRLGVINEDSDVEIIINALLKRGRILAMEMFQYGRKYQKMQDAEAAEE